MSKAQKLLSAAILLVCLILLNVIGSLLNWQWDATDDQFYTLSQSSRDIIDQIEHPIAFEFYYSGGSEELPIRIKNFAERVERLLLQYERASNGKIQLKTIEPQPDSDQEDEANRLGVHRKEMNADDVIYFGLAILQAGRSAVIPLFNPQREKLLEYDVSRELLRVQNRKLPQIGVLSPLKLMGDPFVPEDQRKMEDGTAEWEFIRELRSSFELISIDHRNSSQLPDGLDALLLIHPELFRPELLHSVDQFILSGKPTIITVDPFNYIEDVRDRKDGLVMGAQYNKASRMPPFFAAWGVSMENGILADLVQTTPIPPSPGEPPADYPLWLTVETINREHPATAGLQLASFAFSGALRLEADSELEWTPLLTTSDQAAIVSEDLMQEDPYTVSSLIESTGEVYTKAVLIEGPLKTAFRKDLWQGVPPRFQKALDELWGVGLQESIEDSSLAIIADTDFLHDRFAYEQANFQGQQRFVPRNDNIAFIGNLLESMLGSNKLIGLRGKSETLRPFTVVQEMKLAAQSKYQDQEAEAIAALQKIENRLLELDEELRNRTSFAASREIRLERQKAQREQAIFQKKLREIRKRFREDIEQLERKLGLINVASIPALVAIAGILFHFIRGRRHR